MRYLVAVLGAVLLTCCYQLSNKDAQKDPESDVTLLKQSQLQQASVEAKNAVEYISAVSSQIPAELIDVDAIPASATNDLNLFLPMSGPRVDIDFDVDADGQAETLTAFDGSVLFISWEKDNFAHLSWENDGTTWIVYNSKTDEVLPIVCSMGETTTCQQCNPSECSECDVQGDSVYCDEPEQSSVGECSDSCMAEPDAICCKECGCGGASGSCTPQCSDGFAWDCEMQCCYSYTDHNCE